MRAKDQVTYDDGKAGTVNSVTRRTVEILSREGVLLTRGLDAVQVVGARKVSVSDMADRGRTRPIQPPTKQDAREKKTRLTTTPAPQHPRHPTAFHLLEYVCGTCHEVEVLWNSRDGVSPQGVPCGSGGCRGVKKHLQKGAGRYAPDHKPQVGERVLVDLSMHQARKNRKAYVDARWNDRLASMFETPLQAIEQLALADYNLYGGGRAPYAATVSEGGGYV